MARPPNAKAFVSAGRIRWAGACFLPRPFCRASVPTPAKPPQAALVGRARPSALPLPIVSPRERRDEACPARPPKLRRKRSRMGIPPLGRGSPGRDTDDTYSAFP